MTTAVAGGERMPPTSNSSPRSRPALRIGRGRER